MMPEVKALKSKTRMGMHQFARLLVQKYSKATSQRLLGSCTQGNATNQGNARLARLSDQLFLNQRLGVVSVSVLMADPIVDHVVLRVP
jgi:hypothetical protein